MISFRYTLNMNIKPFELERYFAKHEFSAPYLLSSSDCEPYTLKELLSMADAETSQLWEKLWLGYTDSQGHPLLRAEITKLYDNIKPDNVIVLTPEEGVFIAMNVLLETGDHVIVTNPGYQSLYEIASSTGCEVTKWKPDPQTWEFDVEFIRQNIKPTTKLIVINFPHNPTGSLLTEAQLNELIDIARANDTLIFSDEMYRLLEYKDKDRLPSVADIYNKAISLSGVSKSFALAGLRIGWLTSQNNELLEKIKVFKDYTTICSSAPSEVLALIALRNGSKIVKRNLAIIKNSLEVFNQFVSRHPELIRWTPPKAASIGFPELLKGDVTKFCEDTVHQAGVMVLPASVYDFKGNNFRVGLGRQDFPQALGKLEAYINSKK